MSGNVNSLLKGAPGAVMPSLETTSEFLSSLKTNLDSADIIDRLLECTKNVPVVTSLFRSAHISLKLFEPWLNAHLLSDHPVVVAFVTDIKLVADKFIRTLEMTVQNAGNGFTLSVDTVALCKFLNMHPPSDILSFIEEIRLKAFQAYSSARRRCEVFGFVQRELLEITARIASESKQIEIGNDVILLPENACVSASQEGRKSNKEGNRGMQQYSVTAAADLLRKANRNLSKLVTYVNDFASWCLEAETIFLSLTTTTKQGCSQRLDPIRVEAARRCWEGVSKQYLQYRVSMRSLGDFYPSLYGSTVYPVKNNAPTVLLRLPSTLIASVSFLRRRGLVLTTPKDSPIPADRNEDWERVKTCVTTIVTSILGTAHGALSLSAQVMPFPGLAPAANLLLAILNSLRLVESNDSACLHIVNRCADILLSVHTEITKGGEDLENEIGDCLEKLVASFQTVEICFQRYIQRPFHKRYLERDQISRDLATCHASLNEFLILFGLSVQVHMLKRQVHHQSETVRQLAEISGSLADNKNLLHSLHLHLTDHLSSSSPSAQLYAPETS